MKHPYVRASHDRARLQRVAHYDKPVMMDDVFVCIGEWFPIISLRDSHGVAHAASETYVSAMQGYKSFIKTTIEETLNPFALEGD